MAEPLAENVCAVSGSPGATVPFSSLFGPGAATTLLRGWAETLTETLDKLRQSLKAQLQAGLRAAEAGYLTAASRDPEEFRDRLRAHRRESVACLKPAVETLAEGARFAAAWGLHLTGGMRTVSEAEYQRRLAECAACEFFLDNHCLSCGCRLGGDVVAKARWADEQCPLGKWGGRGEVGACASS
jgi:hypothetical protein